MSSLASPNAFGGVRHNRASKRFRCKGKACDEAAQNVSDLAVSFFLANTPGAPSFSHMAAKRKSDLDSQFYLPADKFFPANGTIGLTFDDVTLATLYSEVLPRDTHLEIQLAPHLRLNIPVISSDMDTVTESRMAIAMALNGGLGLIHYNLPEREQLSEVSRVKNHVHGLIQEPIKVSPEQFIGDVLALIEQKKFGFSTFPVVDEKGKLLGLL